MTKTFCDRCNKDCTSDDIETVFGFELCETCQNELELWLNNPDIELKDRYESLKRLLKQMFEREQTIRQASMPSRASLAKNLLDDVTLNEIKDKLWEEIQ